MAKLLFILKFVNAIGKIFSYFYLTIFISSTKRTVLNRFVKRKYSINNTERSITPKYFCRFTPIIVYKSVIPYLRTVYFVPPTFSDISCWHDHQVLNTENKSIKNVTFINRNVCFVSVIIIIS